ESISTASYRMSERLRRNYWHSSLRTNPSLHQMRSPTHNRSCEHGKLASSHLINTKGDVSVRRDQACPERSRTGARQGNVVGTSRCDVRTAQRAVPTIYEMASRHWKNCYTSKIRGPPYRNTQKRANTGLCLAIIAGAICPPLVAFAQDVSPTPQTAVPAGVTI